MKKWNASLLIIALFILSSSFSNVAVTTTWNRSWVGRIHKAERFFVGNKNGRDVFSFKMLLFYATVYAFF